VRPSPQDAMDEMWPRRQRKVWEWPVVWRTRARLQARDARLQLPAIEKAHGEHAMSHRQQRRILGFLGQSQSVCSARQRARSRHTQRDESVVRRRAVTSTGRAPRCRRSGRQLPGARAVARAHLRRRPPLSETERLRQEKLEAELTPIELGPAAAAVRASAALGQLRDRLASGAAMDRLLARPCVAVAHRALGVSSLRPMWAADLRRWSRGYSASSVVAMRAWSWLGAPVAGRLT